MIGFDEIREAANELKPGTLKLYLYLIENIDGFDFWLSPADVMAKYKISKSTYDRAKAELIEKGYLVETKGKLHFYANKEDRKMPIEELRKNINDLFKKAKLTCSIEQIEDFKTKADKIKLMTNEEDIGLALVELEKHLKSSIISSDTEELF